ALSAADRMHVAGRAGRPPGRVGGEGISLHAVRRPTLGAHEEVAVAAGAELRSDGPGLRAGLSQRKRREVRRDRGACNLEAWDAEQAHEKGAHVPRYRDLQLVVIAGNR